MHWVEIISLRTAGSGHMKLAIEIARAMAKDDSDGGRIVLYEESRLENALSVHIYRDESPHGSGESLLGQKFLDALKDLGLIHHSVWNQVEMN